MLVEYRKNIFKRKDEICIEKISVNIIDPINFKLIKYCWHLNCFSLENFIMASSNAVNKALKCPICSEKCYEFYVDTY